MDGVFNLGKLFGIRFRLHFTWFVVFILVTLSLVHPSYSQWSYWVIGIATSLLLFASVLAHELAHSLVGQANGVTMRSITLFLFGGVAQMDGEVKSPGAELKMAIAGPLCSLTLGGVFGVILFAAPSMPEIVGVMLLRLAVINGVLAAFNLVPGFPLDGGRVLRAVLWHFSGRYGRSTRIAARVGQGVGYLLIAFGLTVVLMKAPGLRLRLDPPLGMDWFDGAWLVLVGWFLENAASSSYREARWRETPRDPPDAGSPELRVMPHDVTRS